MMLEIQRLSVGYGAHRVLHGIDLRAERGELLALIAAHARERQRRPHRPQIKQRERPRIDVAARQAI